MTRRLSILPAPSDLAGFQLGRGKSAQCRALYAAGASTYEIAVFLRLSHAHVRRACRELPPAKAVKPREEEDDGMYFWQWARTHGCRAGKRQARPTENNFQGRYANG